MAQFTRRRLLQTSVAAGATLSAGRAFAAFPERPLRWIVPYPAGGGTDVIARLVGEAMGKVLGQQVIIENQPGASTNLAASTVARAAPDGYTIMTADNAALVNNQALFTRMPFEDSDLRPIGPLARFHMFVCVSTKLGVTTIKDLVARAQAAPGTLNYGSSGVGAPHHLTMERFLKEAKAQVKHVPYRGIAPVMTDILAGTIETAVIDYAAGGEMMRAGQIRPLAICSPKPLAALPNVPTVEEALGFPKFEAYAWQGIVAPAKLPDDVFAALAKAHATAMADPAVLKRMSDLGVEPLKGGAAEFASLIAAERAVWRPFIGTLGLALN